jgi:two-component system heavy metal sensor histidine kinase CusS
VATILAIWLSIFLITRWTMRPIEMLAGEFDKRSRADASVVPEIPDDLPVELRELAKAFDRTLGKVEASRDRERDFALHAAHELRTPVAGIQAILEQALHRERPSEDLRERIGNALVVTEGMRSVVGSLMKLARARGRLEKPECNDFNASTRLHELVNGVEGDLSLRGLSVEWDESGDGMIRSDVELFSIVVGTMLDNVVRHAPSDSMVKIKLRNQDENLLVAIENDCRELKQDDLPRLFEPFQRGEHSRAEGAGLGLSLAREIAALLDGAIGMKLVEERLEVEFSIPSK